MAGKFCSPLKGARKRTYNFFKIIITKEENLPRTDRFHVAPTFFYHLIKFAMGLVNKSDNFFPQLLFQKFPKILLKHFTGQPFHPDFQLY